MKVRRCVDVDDGRPVQATLSPALRVGDLVFVSGQPPLDPRPGPAGAPSGWSQGVPVAGGIEPQARQAFRNMETALRAGGAALADVVRITAYLADIDRDMSAYNRVYLEFFPERPPTRMTLGAQLPGSMLVEVDCIAIVGSGAVADDRA